MSVGDLMTTPVWKRELLKPSMCLNNEPTVTLGRLLCATQNTYSTVNFVNFASGQILSPTPLRRVHG